MILVEPQFTVLSPTSPAEARAALRRVEFAGRICYKSEDRMTDESYIRLIQMLIQKGHWSVLEHAGFTAHIVTNRGVTHELVRHRIASFSQESSRYINYSKGKFGGDLRFVRPPELAGDELDLWAAAMQKAEEAYCGLVARGVSPQIARGALPNDVKAEIVVTANLREWHHIFELRCAPPAHPHMRRVMQMGLAQVVDWFAPVFDDLKEMVDDRLTTAQMRLPLKPEAPVDGPGGGC
jgi:thymidylate synthase (FAD)